MVKKKREITEGKKYISNSNNVYAEIVCIEMDNMWKERFRHATQFSTTIRCIP